MPQLQRWIYASRFVDRSGLDDLCLQPVQVEMAGRGVPVIAARHAWRSKSRQVGGAVDLGVETSSPAHTAARAVSPDRHCGVDVPAAYVRSVRSPASGPRYASCNPAARFAAPTDWAKQIPGDRPNACVTIGHVGGGTFPHAPAPASHRACRARSAFGAAPRRMKNTCVVPLAASVRASHSAPVQRLGLGHVVLPPCDAPSLRRRMASRNPPIIRAGSSLSQDAAKLSMPRSIASRIGRFSQARISDFWALTARGPHARTAATRRSTAASSAAGATTCSTRPQRSAVAASIVSPVQQQFARASPTDQLRQQCRPRRTHPRECRSALRACRRSRPTWRHACRRTRRPPARRRARKPWMRAMTGTGRRRNTSQLRCTNVMKSRAEPASSLAISVMSHRR